MDTSSLEIDVPEFLVGGGELGKLIREFDWSSTSLGPVSSWPQSLRTCVQIMLTSRQPIWIGWGKELIKLYNDPYLSIVKGKHPWALGKPASVVWRDIWKEIEPMLNKVMLKNEGTYVESQLLIMERNGYPEETYYTFSYTPVAGDDGTTQGMICFNVDDTDRIISERQLQTLTKLAKSLTDVKTNHEVFECTIQALKGNTHDFPFGLLYVLEDGKAKLAQSTEVQYAQYNIPEVIDFGEPHQIAQVCAAVCRERKSQVIENINTLINDMPKGAWHVSPSKVIVLPLSRSGGKEVFGFLVIGLNPFRMLDEKYGGFFDLVADQVSISLNNVFAQEEERKRLDALAEIDRAKTTFFSNISHEFRTPLTLLLGPVEDLLQYTLLNDGDKEKLVLVHRNAQRMQKLVNMLLDFSRIEAGRMEAVFTPVDIVELTEDLVSNFRSAVEKAGMELIFWAEPIKQKVNVDVEMWEKIILNLVSNAFKYTEQGKIEVSIKQHGDHINVSVRDTGVGIPQSEIENIFKRFYRVQHSSGRSQEGTGIGLAMVKELVQMHNGSIHATSTPGIGTTFVVTIPIDEKQQHALTRSEKDNHHRTSANAYVQEADQWLNVVNEDGHAFQRKDAAIEKKHTVLLADDNADMRRYVHRLLDKEYNVIVVEDGEEALAKAIQHLPDLILSDVMMPKLDGFGLLKKLKQSLTTRNIPFIFLSARAGEEAKVEGLQAGADDYMTKPFASKELLARIDSHIAISTARRKTEKEFYNLFLQSPAHIHVFKGPEHVVEFFHPMGIRFAGRDITGMKIREGLPHVEGQGFFELLDRVYNNGETFYLPESKAVFRNEQGTSDVYYFNITYLPYRDLYGNIQGVLQFSFEVTELVLAKQKIQESEERLRIVTDVLGLGTWEYDAIAQTLYISERTREIYGFESLTDLRLDDFLTSVVEDDKVLVREAFRFCLEDEASAGKLDVEYTILNKKTGKPIIVRANGKVLYDDKQQPQRLIGSFIDITDRKEAERALRESEARFKALTHSVPQIVWMTDEEGKIEYLNNKWEEYTGTTAEQGMNNFEQQMHPDDIKGVLATWQDALNKVEPWQVDYRLRNNKDNTYRWFHGKTIAIKNEQGQVIKWIGAATDVQQLKDQSAWLEQQVQERTKALSVLNQSLKASNEDLQQFAHVASHDLKEPIRKIKTYSTRLNEEYNTYLPEKGNSFLQKILSATDRMYAMVEGVLSYSTLAAIAQPTAQVNLQEVIKSIQTDLEVLIQEKKVQFEVEPLPVIEGAPVLLYQLFYNLINNSIKFSKPDIPPTIRITAQHYTVSGNEYTKVILSDNGIGFEQEYADKIFTTFTRLNAKDKYEGTGLGLSLCKKIVERHNGYISAIGTKNVGAEFHVILPVHPSA